MPKTSRGITKPLTIAIITLGRTELVNRCVHSLIDQIDRDDEILIITKRKLHLPQKKNVKIVIQKPNYKHQGGARNQAIEEAKNNFIAFIDDDCLPAHNWARRIKKVLQKKKIVFLQGQCNNGEPENIWSTLENITLDVYKEYPKEERPIHGAGIIMTTKNLLLNKNGLPFEPIFINEGHPHLHEDQLLMLKLNLFGIRAEYEKEIGVYHHQNASLLSYLKRLWIDGRTRYWRKYCYRVKAQKVLQKMKVPEGKIVKRQNLFDGIVNAAVIRKAHQLYNDKRLKYTLFRLFWGMRESIRKIGELHELLTTMLSPSTKLKEYFMG